jgi:hypothetical protein
LIDVTPALQALMSVWPRHLRTQVSTLTASPTQLTLTALLPSHEDVESLARAITVPGWTGSAQPQINATSAGVQVQIILKPAAPGPSLAGGAP